MRDVAATPSGDSYFGKKVGAFFQKNDGGLRIFFGGRDSPEKARSAAPGDDDAKGFQSSCNARETAEAKGWGPSPPM